MDKKLESILEDIKKQFPTIYEAMETTIIFGMPISTRFNSYLAGKLKEYAKDYALSLLPEEKIPNGFGIGYENKIIGFNECIKQIKDKI